MSDKVYYDESCYVCSLEINTIRKRGEACGIEFIDISSPDFAVAGNSSFRRRFKSPVFADFRFVWFTWGLLGPEDM